MHFAHATTTHLPERQSPRKTFSSPARTTLSTITDAHENYRRCQYQSRLSWSTNPTFFVPLRDDHIRILLSPLLNLPVYEHK